MSGRQLTTTKLWTGLPFYLNKTRAEVRALQRQMLAPHCLLQKGLCWAQRSSFHWRNQTSAGVWRSWPAPALSPPPLCQQEHSLLPTPQAEPAEGTAPRAGLEHDLDAPQLRGATLHCAQSSPIISACPAGSSPASCTAWGVVWMEAEADGQLCWGQFHYCSRPRLLTFGLGLEVTGIKSKSFVPRGLQSSRDWAGHPRHCCSSCANQYFYLRIIYLKDIRIMPTN